MKDTNSTSNSRRRVKKEQPRKDSKTKRVNYDNERESKFLKDEAKWKDARSNDPSWYAKNPELMKSAASLPFSVTTGELLPFSGNYYHSVPGVMAIYFQHSIGEANTDAINAAATSMYSYVVHANSRNTSYEAADLMMVVLAGMDVFSLVAAGIRAYGTMRNYDQRNKYTPDALVTAMGFNPQDLRANLSKMWFDLNEVVARISQIWIPNTMPVLDRWFWLNSNIYKDSESIRGQMYVLAQDYFWIYNPTIMQTGGGLSIVSNSGAVSSDSSDRFSFAKGDVTWDQYMTVLNGMISALLNSEDRGTIMGDILKAFGADKIYALNPITSDYQVLPTYDREVLTQIENADMVQGSLTPIGIYQKNGRIENYPRVVTSPGTNKGLSILNFHQSELPTEAQVMVATRLKALGEKMVSDGDTSYPAVETTGTEIVTSAKVFAYNESGSLLSADYDAYQPYTSVDIKTVATELVFDWAPWIYSVWDVNGSSVTPVTWAFGDYDQYTSVDVETLKKMNNTALYSLFGVPII